MINPSPEPQALRPWTDFDYWYPRYQRYAEAVDRRRLSSLDKFLKDLDSDERATDELIAQYEQARATPRAPKSRVDFETWWLSLDAPLRETLQRNYQLGVKAASEANRLAVREVLNQLRQR